MATDETPRFPVPPMDERVYAILAEADLPDDLFNQNQHRSCELVELYVLYLAVDLLERLGLVDLLTRPRTVGELLDARRFVAAFRPPLCWLLLRLSAAGLLAREEVAGEPRYRLPASLPAVRLAELRAEGLDADASYAPVFALLDEVAAIYPRVARGETRGERALFQKAALWCAYFSNTNGYYALTNRLTAHTAAVRVGAELDRILEVGAGLGSATQALLETLRARGTLGHLTSYHATEPVAFFRRRAQRTLAAAYAAVPLAFSALDNNRPWTEQGVPPGRQRLVWGVNVFHLARDLHAVLCEAFIALAPGGWLVLGEGLRPFPGQSVGAEFPFQLLESFVDVRTDPERRPTHGFLAPEHWLRALGEVGFARVEIVPDAIRVRTLFPRFFAGAVCGRRPGS